MVLYWSRLTIFILCWGVIENQHLHLCSESSSGVNFLFLYHLTTIYYFCHMTVVPPRQLLDLKLCLGTT